MTVRTRLHDWRNGSSDAYELLFLLCRLGLRLCLAFEHLDVVARFFDCRAGASESLPELENVSVALRNTVRA